MARDRRRKGSPRRFVLLVLVVVALFIAVRAKAYLADQQYVQHYIDTHTTSAPARPSR